MLSAQIALDGKRNVAGDEQHVARRNVDEMLVQVGDADDLGHEGAPRGSDRYIWMRATRDSNLVRDSGGERDG